MPVATKEKILFVCRSRTGDIRMSHGLVSMGRMRKECEGLFIEHNDRLWYMFPILGVALDEDALFKLTLFSEQLDREFSFELFNKFSIIVNSDGDQFIMNKTPRVYASCSKEKAHRQTNEYYTRISKQINQTIIGMDGNLWED